MGKRRYRLKALGIGCTMLISSPSWAVIIEPGQGDLLINQGHGFKPIKSQANAKVGDTVMVRPGGAATVVYDDGCKVTVQPGAVTTIAQLSPCASGSNAQQWPWECGPDPAHPDQTCGWTPGTAAFWLAWLGMDAFIISQILRHHGNAASPASP